MKQVRWAIFLSGRGSNASAALDMRGLCNLQCVVSNKPSADGLRRARRSGVPHFLFSGDWNVLDQKLRSLGVNQIFMLGFMRILPSSFVERWRGRILNLHPSLLPEFPGKDSLERSYAVAGAPLGATVHEVVTEVDQGQIVLRSSMARASSLEQQRLRLSVIEQRMVRSLVYQWQSKERLSPNLRMFLRGSK